MAEEDKKYKLVWIEEEKAYRPQALRTINTPFGIVNVGEFGGQIDSENNLSNGKDLSWVFNNSSIKGDISISGRSFIYNSIITTNSTYGCICDVSIKNSKIVLKNEYSKEGFHIKNSNIIDTNISCIVDISDAKIEHSHIYHSPEKKGKVTIDQNTTITNSEILVDASITIRWANIEISKININENLEWSEPASIYWATIKNSKISSDSKEKLEINKGNISNSTIDFAGKIFCVQIYNSSLRNIIAEITYSNIDKSEFFLKNKEKLLINNSKIENSYFRCSGELYGAVIKKSFIGDIPICITNNCFVRAKIQSKKDFITFSWKTTFDVVSNVSLYINDENKCYFSLFTNAELCDIQYGEIKESEIIPILLTHFSLMIETNDIKTLLSPILFNCYKYMKKCLKEQDILPAHIEEIICQNISSPYEEEDILFPTAKAFIKTIKPLLFKSYINILYCFFIMEQIYLSVKKEKISDLLKEVINETYNNATVDIKTGKILSLDLTSFFKTSEAFLFSCLMEDKKILDYSLLCAT